MIVASRPSTTTVLHVRVVTGAGGGPDKTILRSPRYLRDCGYEELCAYLRPPRDRAFATLERRAASADAELIAIDDRGPLDWGVVRSLVDLCRRRNVLVWHGHDYKSNALGLVVGRYVPLRLVTTVHGWVQHTWRTPLYYFVDRCSLRFYEKVICVSPDLHAACLKAGVPAERCAMLDNAIETDEYARRQSIVQAKARLGYSADTLLVGGIGRLSAEKGFDRLIAAIARLRDRHPTLEAAILGEGAERARLIECIDRLGLGSQVRLVGHCDDVRPWLEAFDAFVLSSLREGLPNVVLEAMSLETPVVATRVAGVPQLIEPEVNGLLVPPDDDDALAHVIDRLLSDQQVRARIAQGGRRTVVERYDFRKRMEKMRAIYDELLCQA
jgi:glycosyltransferase involved in cell wall biosynthesis